MSLMPLQLDFKDSGQHADIMCTSGCVHTVPRQRSPEEPGGTEISQDRKGAVSWALVVRGTRLNSFLSRGEEDEGRPFPSHPFFIGFFWL